MIKYTLSLFCLLLFVNAKSQLTIQSGATFSIQTGAKVTVQGNVTNASGTFTNNGVLEVQGNFSNTGTYSSTSNSDSLLLTGTGAATLNSGSSSFGFLQVNKTSGGGVTLTGNTTVNTKLDFLAGTFTTDTANAYEFIAPVICNLSFAAGTEITGKVRRTSWANGTSVAFNQTNMKLTTNGGTAPTSILVNMIPAGNPSGAEREVKRAFTFTPAGGSGYTADATFPYNTAEVNTNTEANLVPWYLLSSEWNAKLTNNTINTASHFVTTTGIPAVTFAGTEWKLADPNYSFNVGVILRGAWNSASGLMNTTLKTSNLIPLAQPFSVSPFNYTGTETVAAIPNENVVDWVLLELRKPSSGLGADATSSTIIGRKAVFLLNNGSLADLNGVPIPLVTINKQGASFVVVRHRNHLAVMSNSIPSNAAGTFANDFTTIGNIYKKAGASSDPVTPLLGTTKYGLWAGDGNKSGTVNATDVSAIKSAVANSLHGYLFTDTNLSGTINGTDVSLAKSTLASSGSTSASAKMSNQNANGKTVVTNVPE